MNLISFDKVAKSLNGKTLFQDFSFGIDSGDKIGLVGRNGCGKSSLLKLLSGAFLPDSGSISRKRALSASFLEQSPAFSPGETARDFMRGGDSDLIRILAEYESLVRGSGASANSGTRMGELHHLLEERKGFELEHSYLSLLADLGVNAPDEKMSSLSGGMAKKAAIARSIAPECELLLLDEPTNHLDVDAIEWLERRLKARAGAFVIVTHDRYFLDSVCDSILEIDTGRIFRYPGNYSSYLEKRAERYAAMEKEDSRKKAVLKIEMEWLMRGARARAGKSERRKEEIRKLSASLAKKEGKMEAFSAADKRMGKKIVELEGIGKSFDGQRVIEDCDYLFSKGERLGIVGPNGSGKTTFLDIVVGKIQPDRGIVRRGETIRFAYFDQNVSAADREISVLDFVKEKADRIKIGEEASLSAEQFLERFLFPRTSFERSITGLSGGELRRLRLIRLLASESNFLVLDEPTNDFDIETISLFEDFLDSYSGCVLAVSHDRAFLDRVVEKLLVFDGRGGIRDFPGDYSDFMRAKERGDAEARAEKAERGKTDRSRAGTAGMEGKPVKGGKRKLGFSERKEFESLMGKVDELEAEKASLEAVFAKASPAPEEIASASKRYPELLALIEKLTERWESLSELV